jgi:hypothetical protein
MVDEILWESAPLSTLGDPYHNEDEPIDAVFVLEDRKRVNASACLHIYTG